MLMVILCFLMLVCHGLPRAMSQISSHFFFARHQHGQALADSLKSNSSLVELYLPSNNIGDRGAEAPVLGAAAGVGGMSDGFGSWTLLELWQRVIFKGLGVKFD